MTEITFARLSDILTGFVTGPGSSTAGHYAKWNNALGTLLADGVILAADLPLFASGSPGAVPSSGGGTTNFLRADGTWINPSFPTVAANSILGNNTGGATTPLSLTGAQVTAMLSTFTSGLQGLVPASGAVTTNFLRSDGTWASPANFSINTPGYVPAPGSSSTLLFLRADGVWAIADSSPLFSAVAAGDVPASGGGVTNFLRADGSWVAPSALTPSAAGTSGQIQWNNAGSLAGFTASGDATIVPSTGVVTVTKTSGVAFAPSATTDTTNATNIVSGTLSYSRLPSISGLTVLGNPTGVSGTPVAIGDPQLTGLLSQFTPTAQGVVPPSGGGTTAFLRADGTWSVVSGTLSQIAQGFIGNVNGFNQFPGYLTDAQATSILTVFTSGAQGVVPASGGGTTNFLRADGTWAVAGGATSPGGASTNVQFNNSGAFGGDSGFTYAGSGQATLALGTITSTAKALNITATWNNAAVVFQAPLFMSVTNTASSGTGNLGNNNTNLVDLQVGGSSKFVVDKNGRVKANPGAIAPFGVASDPDFAVSTNGGLYAHAAGVIDMAANNNQIMYWDGTAATVCMPTAPSYLVIGGTTAVTISSSKQLLTVTANLVNQAQGGAFQNTNSSGFAELNMMNDSGSSTQRMVVGTGGTATSAPYTNAGYVYTGAATGDLLISCRNGSNSIRFFTNGTETNERMRIDANGNICTNMSGAALATTATNGFTYLPNCAGVPTGVPAVSFTGATPLVVDTTDNRLYGRIGSAWVNLTGGAGGLSGSGASPQVAYWNGASSLTGDSGMNYIGTGVNGKLLLGTITADPSINGTSGMYIAATVGGTQFSFFTGLNYNNKGGSSSDIQIAKTGATTATGRAILAANDTIGAYAFVGDDGTNWNSNALIFGQVDGSNIGVGNMPMLMQFATTRAGDGRTNIDGLTLSGTGNLYWQNSGLFGMGGTFTALTAANTVTISIASPAVITLASHGYVPGQEVSFTTTGSLPTGITSGTKYYVIATGLASGSFQISKAPGGAAVNTSGSQSGTQTCTGSSANTFPLPVMQFGPSGLTGALTSSAVTVAQTWNTTGLVDAAFRINVTNIASNSSSLITDGQVNGSTVWNVSATGQELLSGLLWIKNTTGGIGFGTAFDASLSYTGTSTLSVDANGNFNHGDGTLQLGFARIGTGIVGFNFVGANGPGTNITATPALSTGGQAPGNFVFQNGFSGTGAAATATISNASPAVITEAAHNYFIGEPFTLTTTGTLPTGFSTLTTYYIISAGFAAGSFEASASYGGSAVNTSTAGSGTHTVNPGGVCTISNASPAVITLNNHGLVPGMQVQFSANGGTLPTGLSAATNYFVISAGLTANAFEVSTSLNGSAVNTSTAGSGTFTVLYQGGTTQNPAYAVGTWGPGQLTQQITTPVNSPALNVTQLFNNGTAVGTTTFTVAQQQLLFGNGPIASGLKVYNTVDNIASPTNYEGGIFDWKIVANTLTIGTTAGGTGTARNVFITAGTATSFQSGVICNAAFLSSYFTWNGHSSDFGLNSAGIPVHLTSGPVPQIQFGLNGGGALTNQTGDVGIQRVVPKVMAFSDGTNNGNTNGWMQWAGEQRTTSSTTYTSNTTLSTILTANVIAGRTYAFEIYIPVTASLSTGGIKVALAGTATVTNMIADGHIVSNNAIAGQTQVTSLTTIVNALGGAATGYVEIHGTITVNAAGTFLVQTAQNTSSATSTVVGQGARLIMHDMP